jgi:serine/threonine protein kinase/tetratricopeptide (TPR) repeat protein
MTEAVSANPGRALKARYTLHERLGTGGQGEVWRAHDPQRALDIALKILHPTAASRAVAWAALLHEYESTSRLDHPGILKVFGPERDDGGATLLLPMELAPGGDLRRLRGAGYLAIVPVLLEVAQALEHAHERGVIHRDLKPGNVLFDARGRVKLADFGASARLLDAGGESPRALSPFSASPQQLRGEPPAPSDDVYGLGALAYELLTRYPPHYPNFDAQRVQHEPVPPLVPVEQMPPQLGSLISRMLAKNAKLRPASMREVIDELDAALNDTLTFDFETAEPPREVSPVDPTGRPDQPRAPRPSVSPRSPSPGALAPGVIDGQALWEEVRQTAVPRLSRLEPMRSGTPRLLLLLAGLAVAALAAFFWLPRFSTLPATEARALFNGAPTSAPAPGGTAAPAATADATLRFVFETDRARFDRRLAALETRGAGVWGGADFATAKTRAAESVGAYDAGSLALAQQRLEEASRLLGVVERAAHAALAAQLAAGERALGAGQQELAAQAFDLAVRIDPQDERAALGQSRARRLSGVLPLLADAENAQAARQYSRAAQDYTQALTLDPKNAQARTGLARASAASGDDSYARAAGEGFAALGAGRVEEARAAFTRARSLRPNGSEAQEGLQRVNATSGERGFAALRARGEGLEAQERWDEALQLYTSALRQDRSLVFAQEGKARAAMQIQLGDSLQALIDRPDRLASPQVRDEAVALLQSAEEQPSPGTSLRLQIARLSALLPEFDKPVPLSLVSDSLTRVAIPGVGAFGTFARRDIELKPGHYTVIGTRDGYRDVRRDITVSPGQQTQTVNVSCSEPI